MKTKRYFLTLIVALLSALSLQPSALLFAAPLGRAFTYQGRLNDGGTPANGTFDLKFTLYDSESGPAVINAPLTNAATTVSNGLFTVTLDFGPGAFTGEARWLEIAVRTNGSPADFVVLDPRQPLTATPHARYAVSAGSATLAYSVSAGSITSASLAPGAVTAAGIASNSITTSQLATGSVTSVQLAAGAVGSDQLAPNLAIAGTFTAGAFQGNGAGVTNISLSALPPGVVTNQQTGVTLGGAFNAVTGLVIENRTSDPPSPAVGQIWLRTDL